MKKSRKKSPSRDELKTLVQDLGGPAQLEKILFRFYSKMAQDLMIGFFFEGKDVLEISGQQAKFILNAAGLIERFEGKGPSQAHLKMPPILSGHFDRRLVILREVLTEQGLLPLQIETWIQFEEGFRLMVVSS